MKNLNEKLAAVLAVVIYSCIASLAIGVTVWILRFLIW